MTFLLNCDDIWKTDNCLPQVPRQECNPRWGQQAAWRQIQEIVPGHHLRNNQSWHGYHSVFCNVSPWNVVHRLLRLGKPLSNSSRRHLKGASLTCTRPVSTAVPPRRRLRVTMMLVKSPKTKTMMWVLPPYRDLITWARSYTNKNNPRK